MTYTSYSAMVNHVDTTVEFIVLYALKESLFVKLHNLQVKLMISFLICYYIRSNSGYNLLEVTEETLLWKLYAHLS